MWEMFAKCLGNWRNTAIYWLIIKVFCNLASCTILTFSQPRKMSFDVAFYNPWLFEHSYLSAFQIYLCTNKCFKKRGGGGKPCMSNMHKFHGSSAWLELHNCTFSSKNGWLPQGSTSLQPWLKVHISVKYSNVNLSFQSENEDLHIW